jgi:epoxyqueuosine reductase
MENVTLENHPCSGRGAISDARSGALLKEEMGREARRLGFDLFGVAPALRLDQARERLRDWMERGCGADMAYIERSVNQRCDPEMLLPGARSVLMFGVSYAQTPPDTSLLSGKPEGVVSRFAQGRDYHGVLGPRLEKMAEWLMKARANAKCRSFVDTGPLLERAYAELAGIGFIGKNNCLIHPKHGSWFFLGAIVTNVEMDPDQPIANGCGDCRLCLDACPAAALLQPNCLDARRCYSYLTIEYHDLLADDPMRGMGNRLFGCDSCQSVCPFNKTPLPCRIDELKPSQSDAERLSGSNATLENILALASNRLFEKRCADSPFFRARRRGLVRNALIVAGNTRRKDLREALRSYWISQSHGDVLGETARWSLSRLHS